MRAFGTISLLTTLWIILLLIGERWVYRLAVKRCVRHSELSDPHLHRMAIVADPQLTDAYSYRQQPGMLLSLVQFYSDIYMRRSFGALKHFMQPQSVVFLGDLFDGGREWLDQQTFDAELERFWWVFPRDDQAQFLFMAGNHDVGFGDRIVKSAYDRFAQTFGPLNYVRSIANHTVVVLDTIGLSARQRPDVRDPALQLLERVSTEKDSQVRILFTHVPLYRPPGADCGDSGRQAADIHQGQGYQYQNELDAELSAQVLNAVRPVIVFSGDDHDQCIHHHQNGQLPVPEYTIGTFSWLQGNRYPSFAMLTIDPHERLQDGTVGQSLRVDICYLPQQLDIYLCYAAAFALTLMMLFRAPIMMAYRNSLQADGGLPQWNEKDKPQREQMRRLLTRSARTLQKVLMYGLCWYGLLLWIDS